MLYTTRHKPWWRLCNIHTRTFGVYTEGPEGALGTGGAGAGAGAGASAGVRVGAGVEVETFEGPRALALRDPEKVMSDHLGSSSSSGYMPS